MFTYWPTRFPFQQKPADLVDDLKGPFPNRRPDFALVCHVDQLYAEGFGREDIARYIAWKKGQITITDSAELLRMGRLGLLVVVNE